MKNDSYFRKSSIYMYLVKNRRLLLCAFLWGVPVAVSFVLGWRLQLKGTVFAGSFFLFLLETVCLSVPAAALAAIVLRGGQRYGKESESETQKGAQEAENQHPAWVVWLFYSAVIFLCWLPVFLAYYPSVFAYDAEGQLYQVIAHDYSTHHPLLHTLFLGAFFKLGGIFGSYSAGMAIHSVVQMLLMAAAFGRALCYLYQRQIPRWVRIVLLIFYGLFPTNSVLALSTTKDVLFSALVMLCTVCLYRMVCDRGMQVRKKERAVYVVLMVLMLLFRNNAVYAFVVSVLVLWIGMGRTKARKVYLWMAFMILLLFATGSVTLKAVTRAHSGSPREMLSVPLQ